MTTLSSTPTTSIEEKRFYLLVAEVFFGVISGLMFVFATTFIRDMRTLRNVPDALWNFLCGTPTDNNVTLPLLLTIGIVLLGVTISLEIWRWRLTKTT
ncbi:MAG: hypothetical protein AAFQ07_06600 [Chloroflexota bacterium]